MLDRLTFGKNTSKTVVEVESWVLIKPSRYFISGPALGRISKLEGNINDYSWVVIRTIRM